MDQKSDAPLKTTGRPQRERMPTAKMLALTSFADHSPPVNDSQVQPSNATAAANMEEGKPTTKRGRGRPRKGRSITPTDRSKTKVSSLGRQAQIESGQTQASSSSKRGTPECEIIQYLEEDQAFYDQISYNSVPPVPLPKSDLFELETVETEGTTKKQPREFSIFELAPVESDFEEDNYFEEVRAFYHQPPYNSDPTVPRPDPFQPEVPDMQAAMTEHDVFSCETSSECSENEKTLGALAEFPFSVDMPIVQPIFHFGAAPPSQSGASISLFDESRFHAVKRAPTAQNQHLWQGQPAPRKPRIIATIPSHAECLDRQSVRRQNGEMGTTGGRMSAETDSRQHEDIGEENEGLGAESEGSSALPEIPTVRVDGVSLADVDEFIWHFAGYAGVANPPRDKGQSLDGMTKVLTNWNSIFTIYAAPMAEDSHFIGDQVGLHLAIRLVCKDHVSLLKPLAEYFQGLALLADTEIRTSSDEDMTDFEQNGEISWIYMQLMQRKFAKQARVKIIEIAKIEALKQQEVREMRTRVLFSGSIVSNQVCGSQNVLVTSGKSAVIEKGKQ